MLATILGLICTLAAGGHAQGWRHVNSAAMSERNTLVVVEPDGSVLEAIGDRIIRRRGSVERELRCTARGGTGEIRELAMGPLGTGYAAAERGLFIVDPSVDVVDPVRLGEGAPRGEILSLHCDRADRLWLMTKDELGCVHTSQWFGRVHTAEDGLPAPPYLELALAGEELLLRTSKGVWAYRPDPAPPQLLELRVLHGPDADDAVQCLLRAEALGGASFRKRAMGEHNLREIRDGRIEFAYPGTHVLAIHAFDRELDRSAAQALTVRVPYADSYDPRSLLLPTAAATALLVLGFVARALRAKRPIAKALLDASLALAILLQLLGAILGHGRSYPFIGFGMYSEIRCEGDVVSRPVVQARDRAGVWHEIPAGALSFATDGTWRHLAELLYADPSRRDAFLAERSAALGTPWTAFELRVLRRRLTAQGPIQVAPHILLRHEVASSQR